MHSRVLAVDVGGGTQDIFLYEAGKEIENCVQMVLPSQTVVVAKKIEAATKAGKAVYLHGELMGGGANVKAIKKHLQAGYNVYAASQAAKTIRDDLEYVKKMGVEIIDGDPPGGAEYIEMMDIDPVKLRRVLEYYGVEIPEMWAVAVQDHGESIDMSNREFRFQHWRNFLLKSGDIRNLLYDYDSIPAYFTRMKAVKNVVPNVWTSDTGTAAIWGALGDPLVEKQRQNGLIIVNIGNKHTVGVLLKDYCIQGLFEHHTSKMHSEKLNDYVERLRSGRLTHEEVFQDGGHGCYIKEDFQPGEAYSFRAVTGPRRQLASTDLYYWAVPYGNMMLSGSYGLITALRVKAGKDILL